jgi:carbonic anhydrase/acetyltransferase-like protein (isoleucine patch superfamily)
MTGPLILPYRNILPRIHPTAFIAPNAVVIGDVEIGAHANIWFNVVIRGDDAPIRIAAGANIQDGTVVHVTHDVPSGGEHIPTIIGEDSRSATWRCCTAARWSPAPLSA